MKTSEMIKSTVDGGAKLIRLKKNQVKGEAIQYDVKPIFTGSKKGWIMLDTFTASAMLAVYNGLRPEMQEKFDKISLPRLIDFTWKHVA